LAKGSRKDFDFNIKPSTISSTYRTENQEDKYGEAWESCLSHVVYDIYQSMNSSTLHFVCQLGQLSEICVNHLNEQHIRSISLAIDMNIPLSLLVTC